MGAYLSVLKPGDKILGLNLADGGHLTHGHPLNFSGFLFQVDDYTVKITFAAPMSVLNLTRLLNWYGMKQSDAYTPAH